MSSYTTTEIAQIALASVRVSGGATVSLKGQGTPTTGYGIALNGQGLQVHGFADLTEDQALGFIEAFIDDRRWYLEQPAAYLGAWLDTETGILWLDVTAVGPNRERALALAALTGEIAVWDFAAQAEIRV